MLRLQGYLLTALFVAISFALAFGACDSNGLVVNQPMMNVAALLTIPAMIAAIAALTAPTE